MPVFKASQLDPMPHREMLKENVCAAIDAFEDIWDEPESGMLLLVKEKMDDGDYRIGICFTSTKVLDGEDNINIKMKLENTLPITIDKP